MDAISLSVTYFAILLGVGVLIASALRKRNIPDTVFLMLLGLLLGPTVFSNPIVTQYIHLEMVDVSQMGVIPDFFRILALVLMVFVGTFNLKFSIFKKFSGPSLRLAFGGVILNTIFVGFVANLMFGFDLVLGMLIGAVLGGTDYSVLYVFERAFSKSKNALTILKVESIFNDPAGVLVVILALTMLTISPGAQLEPIKYLSEFWMMITVGVGTGLLVGLGAGYVIKQTRKEYMPLMFFAIALVTYALSVGVGGEGMTAVAVCGLVAGNFSFGEKKEEKLSIMRFEDQFSELLRIAVFTLLGAQVALVMGLGELALILVFFTFVVLFRPLFVLLMIWKRRSEFSRREILVMGFVAPRGVAGAALIPIVTAAVVTMGRPEIAARMFNVTFIVIMLSIIFGTIVVRIAAMERFQEKAGEKKHKKVPAKARAAPAEDAEKKATGEKAAGKDEHEDLFVTIREQGVQA
jgi:cell volume regulation protein A